MARNLTPAEMQETIAYPAGSSADCGGNDAMANDRPKGQQRYTYSSGDRPLDGFTIKRAIGRGGFGEVYYAVSDAGKEVALKLITRNLEVERRGVVQCMNLKSPHLITIHDLKQNEEGDSFVVMEFVNGPSLASILAQHPTGLPAHEVRMWLKGLIDGVAYLHDHGIVHRDLKPANLFLEDGVVKIGDYGLSKAITHQRSEAGHSECVGTCHYMAPETSTGKYHKAIDIYAIGVIIYEMLTGRVPFDGESVGEVLMKHLTARPDLSVLSEPYKNIVTRALAKDPNHRPAKVVDLLFPGDAPREPSIRFLGDSHAPPAEEEARGAKKDDVMRIGAEESVMYIGPETRPPQADRRARWPYRPWLRRAKAAADQRPPVQRAAAMARPVAQPAPRVPRRPAPPPAPPAPRRPAAPPQPPPEPLPPPSGRVRLAELASSMALAAPVAALLSGLVLPLFVLMDIDLPQEPYQLVYLMGLTLLGTWGVLLPSKTWEGKNLDGTAKRLVLLVTGLLVGAAGAALGDWSHLQLSPLWKGQPLDPKSLVKLTNYASPRTIDAGFFAGYFALTFGLIGWWKLTDRARKARFRIWPIVWSGVLASFVGLIWPSPQPWAVLVIVLIAIVAQLVSPWSKPAADYARYAARVKKLA